MNTDLTTKTTAEIKALGFDTQNAIIMHQQNLQVIQAELQRRAQMPQTTSEVTGTPEPEQTEVTGT